MEKKKFLIPADISMSQLVWIIRKRVHMESERALYIYVGKTMPLARLAIIVVVNSCDTIVQFYGAILATQPGCPLQVCSEQ